MSEWSSPESLSVSNLTSSLRNRLLQVHLGSSLQSPSFQWFLHPVPLVPKPSPSPDLLSPSFHQGLHQALAYEAQATGDHTAFGHLGKLQEYGGFSGGLAAWL